MTDIKKLIMENRSESRAIKKDLFASDIEAKEWANRVESVRIILADYARLAREDAPAAELKKVEDNFYSVYKSKILPYFENVSKKEKLHATASDFGALLSLVGVDKRNKDAGKQEFTFVGEGKFRKILENFVSGEKGRGREKEGRAGRKRACAKENGRKKIHCDGNGGKGQQARDKSRIIHTQAAKCGLA